jgi:gamma-glutamylcysteine synthetase
MIAISEGGLQRRSHVDVHSGKDERTHLARLRKLVGEGKTPADVLLQGMEKEKDAAKTMLERSTLTWE